MRKLVLIYLLIFSALPLKAAEIPEEDDGVRAVYATACENIRGEEAKSSARVRATDKASFKALENLSDLSDYRDKYDTHDYNVLIYTLVDNYLEDMAVRTLEQDEGKICVEVTGYLNRSNIDNAVRELAARREAQYPDKLVLEKTALTEPSPAGLPPKPEIKISEDIAVEKILEEEPTLPESDKAPQDPVAIAKTVADDGRTKVFIERTKFYNDTSTNAFHADLARALEENSQAAVTNSLSDADYIIKTKVLRAKVDPINKQTNRLQMVIALELINTADASSMTEHQNRFILFESTENEQNVAASLLKKLLRKAGQQIAPRIKHKTGNRGSDSIITPTAANYRAN